MSSTYPTVPPVDQPVDTLPMYGPQQKTLDLMCGEEVEQQLLAYNER